MLFENITLSKSNLPSYGIPDHGNIVIPGFVTNPEGELCRITFLDDGLFAGATHLSSVQIPPTVWGLGERCFSGCTGLKQVNIPKGILEIRRNAFEGCTSIETLCVPEHVMYVGIGAFDGVQSVTYENDVDGSREAELASLRGFADFVVSNLK